MKLTVLGGKGLLGRHLIPLLAGNDVVVASRSAGGVGEAKADLERRRRSSPSPRDQDDALFSGEPETGSGLTPIHFSDVG